MKLVAKVGGASGPLYGTLFLALGKELPEAPSRAAAASGFRAAIAAVKARGKSDVGQKTMLDVLEPALETFAAGGDFDGCPGCCASRGRQDSPDACDTWTRIFSWRTFGWPRGSGRALSIVDDRRGLRRVRSQLMGNVGIVIVSHSPKVAEGAAEMVRQMVGDEVPLAWTGGNFRRRPGNEFRRDHGSDSTAHGPMPESRFWSISAAPRPTARWRSNVARGQAKASCHLQRADRRRGRHSGDRGVRRL